MTVVAPTAGRSRPAVTRVARTKRVRGAMIAVRAMTMRDAVSVGRKVNARRRANAVTQASAVAAVAVTTGVAAVVDGAKAAFSRGPAAVADAAARAAIPLNRRSGSVR